MRPDVLRRSRFPCHHRAGLWRGRSGRQGRAFGPRFTCQWRRSPDCPPGRAMLRPGRGRGGLGKGPSGGQARPVQIRRYSRDSYRRGRTTRVDRRVERDRAGRGGADDPDRGVAIARARAYARAKAIVPRPGRSHWDLGDCHSARGFAGRPIPSKHDHALRRHGPSRGSPRTLITGLSLGQAERLSRRWRRAVASQISGELMRRA